MRARAWALVAILSTALVGGCGDESPAGGSSPDRPELVVFAASSLGTAFKKYGAEFEGADVRFSFAGSDQLAAQIRQGVIPDVYAAANTSLPDELANEGLIEKPQAFVTNELVLGVPEGSPLDDVSDLEQPGVSVAVGNPEVPVGAYTREVLDALGEEESRAILDNVASSEPDVAGIVGKLNQDAVDAGFVYSSDVAASGGAIVGIELPRAVSPDVAYGIAIATDASEPGLAAEFVRGAVDGDGQEILLDSGFGAPLK